MSTPKAQSQQAKGCWGFGKWLAMAALLAWPGVAGAQGFTTAFVDRALSSFGADDAYFAFDVRNSSTPLFRLAYQAGAANSAGIRYATKTGANGAWSIDSTITWTANNVGLAVGSSSPYTPHLVTDMGSGHASPDPWVGYLTRSGSTWTYESVLRRATGVDTVASLKSCAIALSSGGVPTVAYSIKRASSSYYELWVVTRVSDPTDPWKNRIKVQQATESFTQVKVKVDGVGNPHIVYVGEVSGTLVYLNKATNWTPEISATACSDPSLAMDGSTPHLAWNQAGRLLWGYRDATLGWVTSDLRDAYGAAHQNIALAGSAATPLIAYQNNDSLRVASRTVYGAWCFQRVAEAMPTSVGVGFYNVSGQIKGQVLWAAEQSNATQAHLLSSGTVLQPNDTAPNPAGDTDEWVTDGTWSEIAVTASASRLGGGALVRASVTLGTSGAVRVELLDVAGRRLATSENRGLARGTHAVELRPSGDVASGVYFVRAQLEGRGQATTKVIVVR
ncbi:MAG: T9SS type A sorting domain-containing protein [Candidatus Eisenbacteria bacterium]